MTWESNCARAAQRVRVRSIKRQINAGILKIFTAEEVEAFARARGEKPAKRGVLRAATRIAKSGALSREDYQRMRGRARGTARAHRRKAQSAA